MFGPAIIIFRETLEAALVIGIIAAATRGVPRRGLWLALGVIAGVIGSGVIAGLTETIADIADGSGQELFNAAVLGIAVLMLAWHHIWMASHGAELARDAKQLGSAVKEGSRELSAVAILVSLTVLREGAESVLFLHGMATGGGSSLIAGRRARRTNGPLSDSGRSATRTGNAFVGYLSAAVDHLTVRLHSSRAGRLRVQPQRHANAVLRRHIGTHPLLCSDGAQATRTTIPKI